MELTKEQLQRFWAKVNFQGENGCWNWTGSKDGKGYGHIRIGDRILKTHRISFELSKSIIPDGMCVCHHCDNTSCVNPEHLFVGTNDDNIKDKVAKNRQAHNRGVVSGNAKLTKEDVWEIRRLYSLTNHLTQNTLAVLFNITQTQISNILNNKTWTHI